MENTAVDSEIIGNNDSPAEYDLKSQGSAENFQKFICDLFEKNGVLNDLRSYLRGHIVNVLKSAQDGNLPACQKNFTQRLEKRSQALNMLIAEYLLREDFTYSFSVFISEMPLANMVFNFAKTLVKSTNDEARTLKFNDKDVWLVLNYLGIQCDSKTVTNILESYKSEEVSLLTSILQCVQFCERSDSSSFEQDSQSATQSSSLKSSDSPDRRKRRSRLRCRHRDTCKACKTRYEEVKERYREKRKRVDKMFAQLKTVYETEIEMLRAGEKRRVQSAVDAHAQLIRQRAKELEESYRAREESLEANIRQKKQFLFNLAQNLKEQHKHINKTMLAVKEEGRRLTDKEESLKKQLFESEETLKKRGEEMKAQITNELSILETHLTNMKKERDRISKERIELETLKTILDTDTKLKITNLQNEKNERFQKNERDERSTLTEIHDVTSKLSLVLNNDGSNAMNVKPRLISDILKNNVHCMSNTAEACFVQTSPPCLLEKENALQALREENERLKALAIKQRNEIAHLSGGCSRMQPFHITVQRLANPSVLPVSLNGAGEELSALPASRARVLVPGDAVPFVGVTGGGGKRHLINQWRSLRDTSPVHRSPQVNDIKNAGNSEQNPPRTGSPTADIERQKTSQAKRNKSPVFKIKQHHKQEYKKERTIKSTTQKTENNLVLKEARRRLRKLEIEAEAVEQSYQEFRRQQERRKSLVERDGDGSPGAKHSSTLLNKNPSKELFKPIRPTKDIINDSEKILKDYPININLLKKSTTGTEKIVRPIPLAFLQKEKAKPDYIEKPLNEFRRLYNSEKVNKIEEKVGDWRVAEINDTNIEQENYQVVDIKREVEQISDSNSRIKEENIIDKFKDANRNIIDLTDAEVVKEELITKQAEFEILVDNVNKLSVNKTYSEDTSESEFKVSNLFIQVENCRQTSTVQLSAENLLIDIESLVANEEIEIASTKPEEYEETDINKTQTEIINDTKNLKITKTFQVDSKDIPDATNFNYKNETNNISRINNEENINLTKTFQVDSKDIPETTSLNYEIENKDIPTDKNYESGDDKLAKTFQVDSKDIPETTSLNYEIEPHNIQTEIKNDEPNDVKLTQIFHVDSKETPETTSLKGEYSYVDDFSPEGESDLSISNGLPSPISLGQNIENDDFWQ